jgi:hypothetical protein
MRQPSCDPRARRSRRRLRGPSRRRNTDAALACSSAGSATRSVRASRPALALSPADRPRQRCERVPASGIIARRSSCHERSLRRPFTRWKTPDLQKVQTRSNSPPSGVRGGGEGLTAARVALRRLVVARPRTRACLLEMTVVAEKDEVLLDRPAAEIDREDVVDDAATGRDVCAATPAAVAVASPDLPAELAPYMLRRQAALPSPQLALPPRLARDRMPLASAALRRRVWAAVHDADRPRSHPVSIRPR